MSQDKETLKAGLDSYYAAMSELLEFSPGFSRAGSGGTLDFVTEITPDWRVVDIDTAIANATEMRVSTTNLFYVGRPHIIRPPMPLWTGSFFRVQVMISRPFEVYGWVNARLDDKGHEVSPRHMQPERRSVSLRAAERQWGLKHWRTRAGEIAHFADAAPEAVRKAYVTRYESACDEVRKWESAIAEAQAVTIPAGEEAPLCQ